MVTLITSDTNNPHKKTGYIAHHNSDFKFIGPDRPAQSIDTVDQFIGCSQDYTE